MGIQGRILKFNRELIRDRWIKVTVGGKASTSLSKGTYLGITQGKVLSVTLYLVVINDILGKLGNRMDGLIFTDYLGIYIARRNQMVATRALKELPTS